MCVCVCAGVQVSACSWAWEASEPHIWAGPAGRGSGPRHFAAQEETQEEGKAFNQSDYTTTLQTTICSNGHSMYGSCSHRVHLLSAYCSSVHYEIVHNNHAITLMCDSSGLHMQLYCLLTWGKDNSSGCEGRQRTSFRIVSVTIQVYLSLIQVYNICERRPPLRAVGSCPLWCCSVN